MRTMLMCFNSLVILAVIVFFIQVFTLGQQKEFRSRSIWSWECKGEPGQEQCTKLESSSESSQTLETCKLTCGRYGVLWPRPRGHVTLSSKTVPIHLKSINKTNESYDLLLERKDDLNVRAHMKATTLYGIRHAFETLLQLIAVDEIHDCLQILESAKIADSPAYVHRGVLVDTSRNFISLKTLKLVIDGLSYNKMNVLHWHVTDSQSFPLQLPRIPKLSQYGSYSPNMVYSPADVKELVEYARSRGVRILPELDTPAHVGEGWQWGPDAGMGNLAVCIGKEPWQKYCYQPPCGLLNPVNENLYPVLKDIYTDMLKMFESDLFHMGGDEVLFPCWNETEEIIEWMQTQGYEKEDFIRLWAEKFQKTAYDKLTEANADVKMPVILFTSKLTENERVENYLPKEDYIIQTWEDRDNIGRYAHLISKGYRMIFSNYDSLYLDCGYGPWVGGDGQNWCSPYKSWQRIYDNDIFKIAMNVTNFTLPEEAVRSQVLGGEACLWTETASEGSLLSKIFPRSAALAERLWTDPSSNFTEAEVRLVHHTTRMMQLGISADAIQPLWCYQNPGLCYIFP
ncbi:unnamed protein product [Darwinula stevensoni]|uniref:Beta-hexosaminidase n=1 Tax=Darwinula stevensoni TaxID=69355 RepID=A0A7R8X4R0_9CRUS|nr:unnamed protein product [Darwinula stevensoni]CAG0879764.1 unnamed protein product [Darwinula stevensoni]